MTSQIIYHLLYICGDKLVEYYRKAFKQILGIIINDWLPKYEAYEMVGSTEGPMYKEVQNKPDFMNDGVVSKQNTGIDMVSKFNRQMLKEAKKHLESCENPNFRSREAFLG